MSATRPAHPPTSAPAVSMHAVRKSFGSKVAVRSMDLTLDPARVYGFIGPNGAGKTTTIRMIMSILFPDSGELSVLGRRSAVESKDRIGYLPEERGVYRKMKVAAYLRYMGRLKGLPREQLRKDVGAWLERVGLADTAKKKCEELSKGMQQKVQFIAAILHDPELVILDEPFSGLDPVNARLMRSLIGEMKDAGKTVLFSTHVMEHAEQLCDHIVMINNGEKVLDSSLAEIYASHDPRCVVAEPAGVVFTDEQEDALGCLEGVERTTRSGDALELHLAERADPQGVMSAVLGAVSARRVELRRVRLEDVFVSIVLGSEHAGADEESLREALRAGVATEGGGA